MSDHPTTYAGFKRPDLGDYQGSWHTPVNGNWTIADQLLYMCRNWKESVLTVGDLPATGNFDNDVRLVQDAGFGSPGFYRWKNPPGTWEGPIGGSGSGGYQPSNLIYVDPSSIEIPGKVYPNAQDAFDYAVSQGPSDSNRFALLFAPGLYSNFTLDMSADVGGDIDLIPVVHFSANCYSNGVLDYEPYRFVTLENSTGTMFTVISGTDRVISGFRLIVSGAGVLFSSGVLRLNDCYLDLSVPPTTGNDLSMRQGLISFGGVTLASNITLVDVQLGGGPITIPASVTLRLRRCYLTPNTNLFTIDTGGTLDIQSCDIVAGSTEFVVGTGTVNLYSTSLNGNTLANTLTVNGATVNEDYELATKKYVDDSLGYIPINHLYFDLYSLQADNVNGPIFSDFTAMANYFNTHNTVAVPGNLRTRWVMHILDIDRNSTPPPPPYLLPPVLPSYVDIYPTSLSIRLTVTGEGLRTNVTVPQFRLYGDCRFSLINFNCGVQLGLYANITDANFISFVNCINTMTINTGAFISSLNFVGCINGPNNLTGYFRSISATDSKFNNVEFLAAGSIISPSFNATRCLIGGSINTTSWGSYGGVALRLTDCSSANDYEAFLNLGTPANAVEITSSFRDGFKKSITTGTTTISSAVTSNWFRGVRWDYVISNGVDASRVGYIEANWLGYSFSYTEESTSSIGDTNGFQFVVAVAGGVISLNAVVTSGVWSVKGYKTIIG